MGYSRGWELKKGGPALELARLFGLLSGWSEGQFILGRPLVGLAGLPRQLFYHLAGACH
jgi:hypothetical protein